jgi:hypothetical protein
MDRSALRLLVIALLLAAVLGAVPAAAAQPPAPRPSHGALAALASPGASLARLVAWVVGLLPGGGHGGALAPAGQAGGSSGPGVQPDEGGAIDPYG